MIFHLERIAKFGVSDPFSAKIKQLMAKPESGPNGGEKSILINFEKQRSAAKVKAMSSSVTLSHDMDSVTLKNELAVGASPVNSSTKLVLKSKGRNICGARSQSLYVTVPTLFENQSVLIKQMTIVMVLNKFSSSPVDLLRLSTVRNLNPKPLQN